jgi:predicted permease
MARDIDAELQFHVDALVDELVERGASHEEARRIAQLRFGRLDLIRDEARYAKGVGLIDDLRQDVRYGLRQLRRQPAFALAVVVLFGLGIGVNTAIFSIVDALVLKPMPFCDADRLVDVLEVLRKGTAEETHYTGMSRARLDEWRAQRDIYDAIEPYRKPRRALSGSGEAALVVSEISPGLFPMLGVSPAFGRLFSSSDHADDVAIISHGLWKRLYGSDPRVLGRRLKVDDRSPAVVGVLPPGTRFPLSSRATDVWLPLGESGVVHVVAKLRRGMTLRSAQPAVDRAAAAIQQVRPSREPWGGEIVTIDPRRDPFTDGPRPVVWLGFGAVAFVLLTACANVANLLLARASSRQREFAVRRALGAGRLRLARQLLVESGILAIGGAAAAVLLAAWGVRLIPAILPERLIWFPVHEMQLDWRVLAFAFGTSVAVGLLSGAVPAFRGSRGGSAGLLAATVPMATRTRLHRRTRDAFLAIQVAFALVLLAGAGLMTASFASMTMSDPGYDTRDVLVASVSLPAATYRSEAEQRRFLARLLETVRSIPGVVRATTGTPPTIGGGGNLVAEGSERVQASGGPLKILWTGADYFPTMGIRIVAGRQFSADDRPDAAPVGILSEDAARRAWPGQSPLGKRFRYSPYVPWITVVGVARPIKTSEVGEARDVPQLYLPESQHLQGLMLLVRTSDDSTPVLRGIHARLSTLEPRAKIPYSRTVEEMYSEVLVNPRFMTLAMLLFAGLALLTASVGVYAMLRYTVAQRMAEIGVRMALGAPPARVRRLVFADALAPIGAGVLVGLVIAWWLARFIASFLYHVSAHDPVTLALAVAFLGVVAALAAYGPARRATRVDPILALRCE